MLDSTSPHREPPLPHRRLSTLHKAVQLQRRWNELCEEFLPVVKIETIWRFSREGWPSDQTQGWKIHVSATILSACGVLEAAAPCLNKLGILFKAPNSLDELAKMNSGLWYGYSQVGKFITAYPADVEVFREAMASLARLLPRSVESPGIPFELVYQPEACSPKNLFYRYGGFAARTIITDSGIGLPAIVDPKGTLVEDHREVPYPEWVEDPLHVCGLRNEDTPPDTPIGSRFRVIRCISQRGKGGIYEAVDLEAIPLKPCILKEGRRHGETGWDGRDGSDRIGHEGDVLEELCGSGVRVPEVFDRFQTWGNSYLVLAKLEGVTLTEFTSDMSELTTAELVTIFLSIARAVSGIHAAGWVWRDCKPGNLIVGTDLEVSAIDFEGATRIDTFDPLPWNTPNFSPPELLSLGRTKSAETNLHEDLFALGAVLKFVLTKIDDEPNGPKKPGSTKRPLDAKQRSFKKLTLGLIKELMSDIPEARPSADDAAGRLRDFQRHLS